MKIIISKILNRTDLAQSGSHGGLVVYKKDRQLLLDFFEQPKIEQNFIDKNGGEIFPIRYADYTTNGKTPNDRITPIGSYANKQNLKPGDIIIFEKNISESGKQYYIEYARRLKSVFFTGKSNTSVEVLNVDQLVGIITRNVAAGVISRVSDNSYEMQVTYEGEEGILLLIQSTEKLEMYFDGEHIEENNKYYELDTSVIPFDLRKMSTWNIKFNMDSEVVEANQIADDELVNALSTEDFEINEDEYIPHPEQKAGKVHKNGRDVPKRDKEKAKKSLKRAAFNCEYKSEHESFIRKNTNVKYMEPHHLIPLQYDDEFNKELDIQANIVSLCSNCHNKIHYGADAKILITDLWEKRKDEVKAAGIGVMKNGVEVDLNVLLSYYGLN